LISSAFAGGGFISPRQYDRFVLPYEAEVVGRIHAEGVPVYTHTCGDIGDRLERMAATGIDGSTPWTRRPWEASIWRTPSGAWATACSSRGHRPVNTLLKRSRQEVRADALERLRIGSPGGGYILSSACSVSPRVPPENLTVLVEASKQFAARSV